MGNPLPDLLPMLRRTQGISVANPNPAGQTPVLRMNQLHPPFDNPALRRVLLSAVDQMGFLTAVVGEDPALKHVPAGFFTPGTPMASDAGLDALHAKPDVPADAKAIRDAGYRGEPVLLLAPTDVPILKALADVGADLVGRVDLKVDYQAMDWGSAVQRRVSKAPSGADGWSVFHTVWNGADMLTPATNMMLRGNGAAAPGWPSSSASRGLREQWLAAMDESEQKRLAAEMRVRAFVDVPYVPLGQDFVTTAYQRMTGVLEGFAIFWRVQKA